LLVSSMSKAEDVNSDFLGTPPIVLGLVPRASELLPSGDDDGALPTLLGDVRTSELVPGGEGGGVVPALVEAAEEGAGGAAVPAPIEGRVGDGVDVPTPCANTEPATSAVAIAVTSNDVCRDCLLDDIMRRLLSSQDGRFPPSLE